MNEAHIKELLEAVREGSMGTDAAFAALKDLPYKDLGFANVDHHRSIRTGFPEVIFGQGKTPQQIRDIFAELAGRGRHVMATRASQKAFEAVREALPQAIYYEAARIIVVPEGEHEAGRPAEDLSLLTEGPDPLGRVCVVSAGTADIPVAEEAAVTAQVLGCQADRVYDVGVAGIHRLFDKLPIIRQAQVVVVAAGMEGALASVLGGLVEAPVIAVPTSIGYGANLGGLSALLSMLNSCANGVSVVNIDNGFGAAYMAATICRQIAGRG